MLTPNLFANSNESHIMLFQIQSFLSIFFTNLSTTVIAKRRKIGRNSHMKYREESILLVLQCYAMYFLLHGKMKKSEKKV
ncbi:hypothetical protein Lal_00002041 [Lupinus albus]|nr:hypothetical protein Lal_00002041 [Lupinus albus]